MDAKDLPKVRNFCVEAGTQALSRVLRVAPPSYPMIFRSLRLLKEVRQSTKITTFLLW
jgi:hypothetical protein